MKKNRLLALAAASVFALAGCSSNNNTEGGSSVEDNQAVESISTETAPVEGSLKDGTYTASGQGFDGDVNITAEIKDGQIASIKADENKESPEVFDRAFPIIEERVVESQSANFDTVTSATFTSNAVKNAMNDIIVQAGGQEEELNLDFSQDPAGENEAEDVTTDLVVVGGGPAGLSAAIEAKNKGIENVILVEKLDILSGNGKFDMNFFDMPNSKAMKDNGVEVSKEEFLEMKEGAWDSEARKEAWVDKAWDLDQWLRDMGVELNFNYGGEKGMSHMAEEDQYSGDVIQHGLEKKVNELGVDVRTGTMGYDLIFDGDDLKGVAVRDKDNKYNIMADAVVIATGGFSNNKDLLEEYLPGTEKIINSNSMGATGDFIGVAKDHDIKLDHMDEQVVFKLGLSKNRMLTGAGDGFILVNEEGKRFVDESEGGLEMGLTLKENSPVYYIYDQRLYDSMYRPKKHVELGYHVEADSVEELAEKLGIPADALQASIDQYNKGVEGEEKDPIREEPSEFTIDTNGKLYGAQVESVQHMTKGGIVANEKAEVQNNAGQVIPGLYVAGEASDTAAAYSGAVVFGRISGESAAAYINK